MTVMTALIGAVIILVFVVTWLCAKVMFMQVELDAINAFLKVIADHVKPEDS